MGYVLGLGGGYYHDASACLLSEGTVIAFAEEERFTRRKHNKDSRNCSLAAAYCLSEAGITLADVEEVGIGWNHRWPEPSEVVEDSRLIRELLDEGMFAHLPRRLSIVPHHRAHAASAFYASGFTDAAVLVVDGSGDGVSTTIAVGSARGIDVRRQYPFTQSLGWFYETVAEHLGLGSWTSAGKVMGLAAYGVPRFDLPFLRVIDDGYFLDLGQLGVAESGAERGYANLDFYRSLKTGYRRAFAQAGVTQQPPSARYRVDTGAFEVTTTFDEARRDLAASAQHRLEECLVSLARCALAEANSDRLCLAGGVALNCSANGVLRRQSGVRELFVQPVSGDAGLALGVALDIAVRRGDFHVPGPPMRTAALGPSFSDDTITNVLDSCGIRADYLGERLPEVTAEAIARGAVVGWFQGRMEVGPRALGQRSIIASPQSAETRDRINRSIKKREMWRPLAPSLLDVEAGRLLQGGGRADFMVVADVATSDARELTPACVHIDGSVRPQIVPSGADSAYRRLLEAMSAISGVGAVLNTSFNHETEPIVCTPIDALRTFFATPLDALAIGGYLVYKNSGHGPSR